MLEIQVSGHREGCFEFVSIRAGCLAFANAVLLSFTLVGGAHANLLLKKDDIHWLSLGLGVRYSLTITEDAAPNGTSSGKDFKVQDTVIYIDGQLHDKIKLTYNSEINASTNGVEVLDAITRFEFDPAFNVWAGRLLVPTDRSVLAGPFYQTTYDFPLVRKYPAIFIGRDNGVVAWGRTMSDRFKYYLGIFDGRKGGPNDSDSLLYAGRVVMNIWGSEPAYYNRNSYHGRKNILAFGVGAASQKNGAGADALSQGNFSGWNADFLLDKKLSSGAVTTVEAAYYNYALGGATNDPSLIAGDGYFVVLGYMLAHPVLSGRLQPHVRYQQLDYDNGRKIDKEELGINYLFDSHDVKLSLTYGNLYDSSPNTKTKSVKLGAQLKF